MDIHGSYNYGFVALSILIAIFASYTALDLSGRITYSKKGAKRLWLFGGAITMGLGIWSMHFVAMLALHLPILVTYDFFLVSISVVVAILASFVALFVVSRETMSSLQLLIGGLFMSTAIVVMHYTGMFAMQIPAVIHYNKLLVALSVFIALTASITALKIAFYYRTQTSEQFLGKFLSAVVMGIAISGMHYTGMAAANYKTVNDTTFLSSDFPIDTALLAGGIGIAILIIQIFVIFSTGMDRKLTIQNKKLKESQQRYDSLVKYNLDIIFMINEKGRLVNVNSSVTDILGVALDETINLRLLSLLPIEEKKKGMRYYLKTLKGVPQRFEIKVNHANMSTRVLNVTTVPIYVDDQIDGIYGIAKDITSEKAALEQVNHWAHFDDLTNLPNRRNFYEQATSFIEKNTDLKNAALFVMDLDRFKIVNDTLGHLYGDYLLKEISERFTPCIGEKDLLARMSGDEFTLFVPDFESVEQVELIAKKLLMSLEEPFIINNHEIFISSSIGISLYPNDAEKVDELFKNADLAMYLAKENGASGYQFYCRNLDNRLEKIHLEEEMRRAIHHEDEFILCYQPKIDLMSKRVTGVEALVRWSHPRLGFISPAEFIPLAEETGLIVPLGEKILKIACSQLKKWHTLGSDHLHVAVNVATRQFMQDDFVEKLQRILIENELDGRFLELEVTESTAMNNVRRAIYTFNKLRELGVNIAIDDFGTGYSSLSYLKDYPINTLKIDRSFIQNLSTDGPNEAIVASIISLAKNMHLNIVAEGVETDVQVDFLKEKQCDQVQGFLFSKPLLAEDFENTFLSTAAAIK